VARRSIKIRLLHCDISHTVLIGACVICPSCYKPGNPATSIDNRQITIDKETTMSAELLFPNPGIEARGDARRTIHPTIDK